ncbi:MAG: rod shape-determining protein MreD [Oscillospiraceae bacterium]|nr:rod shape-determining protein MreD [Oscillospiraceae bacterium]
MNNSASKDLVFKWIRYSLYLIGLFILTNAPSSIGLFGARPQWLLVFALIVSMFETIIPTVIISIAAGILLDYSQGTLIGYNCLVMLALCFGVFLANTYLLKHKMLNAITTCAICLALHGLLYYFFYFYIWSLSGSFYFIFYKLLPQVFLSLIVAVPIFWAFNKVFEKRNKPSISKYSHRF